HPGRHPLPTRRSSDLKPTHHPTHSHKPTHKPTHHPTHSPTHSHSPSPSVAPTAPSTPGGGTLPVTGSETSAFTVIAAAAAFLGAVLIAMTRRRRPARHRLK